MCNSKITMRLQMGRLAGYRDCGKFCVNWLNFATSETNCTKFYGTSLSILSLSYHLSLILLSLSISIYHLSSLSPIYPPILSVESRNNHWHSGGTRVRDAVVYLPLQGGDLRKNINIFCKRAVLQKGVLFCKLISSRKMSAKVLKVGCFCSILILYRKKACCAKKYTFLSLFLSILQSSGFFRWSHASILPPSLSLVNTSSLY